MLGYILPILLLSAVKANNASENASLAATTITLGSEGMLVSGHLDHANVSNMHRNNASIRLSNNEIAEEEDMADYNRTRMILRSVERNVFKYYISSMVILGGFGCIITIIVLQKGALASSASVYMRAIACANLFVVTNNTFLVINHYECVSRTVVWRSIYSYYVAYLIPFTLWAMAANAWTIIAFSIERLMAITYPLKSHVICSEGRAKKIVLTIYIVLLLANISRFFAMGVRVQRDPVTNATLHAYYYTEFGSEPLNTRLQYVFFAIYSVFIPLPIVAVLNIVIILKLRRLHREQRNLQEGLAYRYSKETKNSQIERVLVAGMTAFCVCNALPASVVITVSIYGYRIFEEYIIEFQVRRLVMSMFYILNPFLNFVLYVICSAQLRHAVFDLFCFGRRFRDKQLARSSGAETCVTTIKS